MKELITSEDFREYIGQNVIVFDTRTISASNMEVIGMSKSGYVYFGSGQSCHSIFTYDDPGKRPVGHGCRYFYKDNDNSDALMAIFLDELRSRLESLGQSL